MRLFRALKYQNYRLYFFGQSFSLVGTWMQQVAVGWLVWNLTHSALWLGVVGFASHIPNFLFTPIAGVFADRWNRHHILLITQTLSACQATLLAFLTFTGMIQLWHIVGLVFALGWINAFDIPARQSFFVQLIGNKKDLGNAIALNSSMFNLARLLGPSIAGLLIASLGEAICFMVNALSFLPVVIALSLMKLGERKREDMVAPVWHGLKEGVTYIFGFPPIRVILILLAFIGLTGMSYTVLIPVFASTILHGGPQIFGFLVASAGCGALCGALTLAVRKKVLGLEKLMALAVCLFGMGLVAFAQSKVLWFSMVTLFFSGFALMLLLASANTVLQTIVEDDKRGRLMSFYSICILGTAPFGHLLVGALAHEIGASLTLSGCGILCVLGSLLFFRKLPVIHEQMQPVYVRMGLLPQVVSGIQTASNLTVPPED